MQIPRSGWAKVVLDVFTPGTKTPLSNVRASIGTYHGCQMHDGNCSKCDEMDGGCKGFIEDKEIDYQIIEMETLFEAMCDKKEIDAVLAHCSQEADL